MPSGPAGDDCHRRPGGGRSRLPKIFRPVLISVPMPYGEVGVAAAAALSPVVCRGGLSGWLRSVVSVPAA